MLYQNKIIFVQLLDKRDKPFNEFYSRVWQHEKFVKSLLEKKNCIIGKSLYEETKWKGPKTWVLTRDKNFKDVNVGSIHDIEDFHLFIEGPIYILGGNSLFKQLIGYADEIHRFNISNILSGEKTHMKIDYKDWAISETVEYPDCLYTKLIKKIK